MQEIAPGIRHWTAEHPDIGTHVSSYWLPRERLLLDPLAVPDGVDEVDFILLTNRLHRRDALESRERFGASLHVPRAGMHDWEGDPVEGYEPGDELAGGTVTVHEVGAISADESALHIPSVKALAVADGVIHYGEELAFVSDKLMDDPEETKRGLREAYARLTDELDFNNLLTAHGTPITGSARERLREFASA